MPATDNYATFQANLEAPYERGEAATPHDTNELTLASRAIYVGGAGALALVLVSGDAVTLSGVPAGTMLRVRAKQVKSTGTTATNIVALS